MPGNVALDEQIKRSEELLDRRAALIADAEFHRRVKRGEDDLAAGRVVSFDDLETKYGRSAE
ncbi:MAG: hypothetical protein EPO26_03145 [Chloroflexota bacterium]|nr:MAG: hypothetical protein EPO26_03145 [Chloroflexota bacterium]